MNFLSSPGRRLWCLMATFIYVFALAARAEPPGTVIYTAKEFITMDPAKPRAEAIAVRDGRFFAVGTREEVFEAVKASGEGAQVDDIFGDKVVMAGFIEQHVHPFLAAVTMNTHVISIEDWDAIDGFSPAVRDQKAYRARLRAALDGHADKSKPFLTWGYHHYFHGEMSRELLDSWAPDFPVFVWHRSAHEFYLNTPALAMLEIDAAFVAALPPGVRKHIDFERGHFYEQGAMAALPALMPILASPENLQRGLQYSEDYYHRSGITFACEPGGFLDAELQQAVNSVYSDDATPFNHAFIVDGKTLAGTYPDDAAALLKASESVLDWGRGRTFYLPRQAKLFTDGAIYSQLMMMEDGYTDGHHGAWIMDPPLFDYAFQTYWDAGYQIHVHNNGDEGMAVLLASLESAMKRNPRDDHRTVVVHFGFAQPDQVKRWVELGGLVSANPYYVSVLASRYAKLGIGPERAQNMVPLGDAVASGGSISFHSDMPMAPAKPLLLVWAAVNRLTVEGEVMGPKQRVSVDQALRAITIDAAYSVRMEERIGSIEVGKDANLTILGASPYEVEPLAIRDIAVWGTMLEGRVQPVNRESM